MDDNNNYLFDRTVKKLGALADNEMFGLEPAYILGGEIKKVFFIQKIEFSDGKIIIDNESVSWSLKKVSTQTEYSCYIQIHKKRKKSFI
ncbi:T6SS immunity protein Tdi1 domain-containing protein [Salmonella enterica]|uniref:T6SS immunity protein Tdi1 domain-containing protein n=1 Tax=Salmonella enterica TaxID=28901 RepID=UPI003EDC4398